VYFLALCKINEAKASKQLATAPRPPLGSSTKFIKIYYQ